MRLNFSSNIKLAYTTAFVILLLSANAFAQPGKSATQSAPQADEKAEKVLQRGIEALGGSNYLNVRSSIGRGFFTQFKDGASSLPMSFVDYVIYPDRERTEFKGTGTRVIQVNTGDTGWVFDGTAKNIKDMTKEQATDFRQAMRTSFENLLRGWWRKEGAKLSYIGRREAGIGMRNEAVRLAYPDGFTIEFEFGARDALPAKIIYKKKTEEGEEVTEEDRLAQLVSTGGVTAPFIIDHYRAGVQMSRVNYQSIEFNATIPDSLFARPANIKALK
ncbi:MAG: hypothetical protein WBP93_02835 [Pyrinomonadaceae bacterium]